MSFADIVKRDCIQSKSEIDNTTDEFKLPGGRRYQRDGDRLEKASIKSFPKSLQRYLKTNVKPKNDKGNVIVEFDVIYHCESSKEIVSFEIKGVNKDTINNVVRQTTLLKQGLRQKKFLLDNYPGYTINTIYCFIMGKTKKEKTSVKSEWNVVSHIHKKCSIEQTFIKKLLDNGIKVAIGETPQHCIRKALTILNLLK